MQTSCVTYLSFLVFFLREEKKKKQKLEGWDTEEKIFSYVGSAVDQGPKSGGGPTQQSLKRGQKVREDSLVLKHFLLSLFLPCFTYDAKEWSQ